jgi:hypothetical protein
MLKKLTRKFLTLFVLCAALTALLSSPVERKAMANPYQCPGCACMDFIINGQCVTQCWCVNCYYEYPCEW